MATKPSASDPLNWGTKYNAFLDVAHNANGTLKLDTPSELSSVSITLGSAQQIHATKSCILYIYGSGDGQVGWTVKLGAANPPTVIALRAQSDNSGAGEVLPITLYVPAGWYIKAETSIGSPVLTATYMTWG
jgi:alpha-tubulin suppressor-like RCC1 family protein